MMHNILIIHAGKAFGHSAGKLNKTLTEVAIGELRHQNHDVRVTWVDQGYDIEQEVQNYLWADAIIYQMPGW